MNFFEYQARARIRTRWLVALYVLAVALFRLSFGWLHFRWWIAATIAYFFAVTFHFVANKLFTFEDRDQRLHRQMARYLLVSLANYLISMVCMKFLTRFSCVPTTFAFCLSVAATMILSYLLLRFWVFSRH